MSPVDHYAIELARTVNDMFASGKLDPAAWEIAEEHFPDRALGGEIIDGIQKRLPRVRNILEEEFNHAVYLLSKTYYIRGFRDNPPTIEADARQCIPRGRTKRSTGIRLNTDKDTDLIYILSLGYNLSSGGSKVKKTVDRITTAVQEKRLTMKRAESLLGGLQKELEPSRQKLADEIMKELPPKKEGEE